MSAPLLYMRMKGDSFAGEEPIDNDQKLIRIGSYSHGVKMPVTSARPSTGETVDLRRGPCEHAFFTVTKGLDKVSAQLFEAAAAGVVFEQVLIHMCSLATDFKKKSNGMDSILTIALTNAVMTSFQYSYSGAWPTEVIDFSYTSIYWAVNWPDPTNGKLGMIEKGWDGVLNKVAFKEAEKSLVFKDAT